jgi:fatty acid desaturase
MTAAFSLKESSMQGTLSAGIDPAEPLSPPDAAAVPAWIRDARQSIKQAGTDFFRVSPLRYWTDFLVSLVLAYGAATVYLLAPLGSWQQLVAFPIAVFWLYRLGSLIHEVCHLGAHEMRVFKVTWNLLVGVFTLTPSPFFTRHHRDHHSQRMYGTPEDPEYVANVLEAGNWKSAVGYGLFMLAFPILVFLRFLLAPLSFLHPRLRQFVLERGSSLTLNLRYHRQITPFDRRVITVLELLCFVRAAAIPLAVFTGAAPLSRIPLLYALGLTTLVMNQMRQLADHHFEGDGSRSNVEAHILDSCNYSGNDPLTLLFFPFSIRYHALHHLFPSLPYHNLAAAHAYLTEHLPADSPYHGLDQPGWWPVAKRTIFGGGRPAAAA